MSKIDHRPKYKTPNYKTYRKPLRYQVQRFPKAWGIKEKNWQTALHQNKKLLFFKRNCQENVIMGHILGENILNPVSDRGLESRICEELWKQSDKQL